MAAVADSTSDRSTFRPDIAMLRALAVTLVLGFHVLPFRVTGGYIGVDVFFVISGFLMTAHIQRAAAMKSFSYKRFYLRRATRLLPAALVVICLTLVAMLLFVPEVYWIPFAQQGLASAVYVENAKLAADAVDYLALASGASPFQHYWSLSVEEQFYLVWPVLIVTSVGVARLRRRWVPGPIGVVMTVGILSLIWSVLATATSPATAYFSTFARLWEFAAGGMVALLPARPVLNRLTHLTLWILSLTTVILSAFVLDATSAFPGALAAIPVVGTAAMLFLGSPPSPRDLVARAVAWAPVQGLGKISYSVYLIHWPIIVLSPFVLGRKVSGPITVTIWLALSIALGALLWCSVERRGQHLPTIAVTQSHRRRAPRPERPRRRVAALVTATVVTASLAGCTWAATARDRARAQDLLDSVVASATPCLGAGVFLTGCATDTSTTRGPVVPVPAFASADNDHKDCLQGPQESDVLVCHLQAVEHPTLRVAVVGDSHAAHWTPALSLVARKRNWSLDSLVKSSCPLSTVSLSTSASAAACRTWNHAVMSTLTASRYDLVFVSAAAGEKYVHSRGQMSDAAAAHGMAEQWKRLGAAGSTVIAIRDNPRPGKAGLDNPPACVEDSSTRDCTFDRTSALPVDPQVMAVAMVPGSRVVDLTPELCPASPCSSVIGGVMVYRDDSHLTSTYATTLGPWLDRALPTPL